MILQKKIQAGTLLSTLILALIVFTGCSILLLGVYYTRYFMIKESISERLDENMISTTTLILSDPKIQEQPYSDSALLFSHKTDSIYYSQKLWGAFPMMYIKVTSQNRQKEKVFLYGASEHLLKDATLYLADHNKPLSLVGETYIDGKVYIPKSGIQSGFFDQKGFSRKRLILGSIDSSQKELPQIHPAYYKHLRYLTQLIYDTLQTQSHIENTYNSFLAPPILYKANSIGVLYKKELYGNIIIVSDSLLDIDSSNRLNNIVLIAPDIRFKEGFKGSVQAIALNSITIEKKCHFTYPSAVVSIGRVECQGNNETSVIVGEESIIEGIVIACNETLLNNPSPVIKIKKDATVKGIAFSMGYINLYGSVQGAVYTNYFSDQRGPVNLENTLTDAAILKSDWYLKGNLLSILKGANHQKVIKWLD